MNARPLLEGMLGALSAACALGLVLPRSTPQGAPPEKLRIVETERSKPEALTASYTLSAELDAVNHRVHARGTIHFTNTSRAPLDALYFHLYLNAFKNERSVFLRSPFANSRDDTHGREFGYIDVKWLKAQQLGDVDLWLNRSKHSPSDPEDETDIEVPLPSPLAAGAALDLDVEFESQLPEVMERTGYAGSFHFVGQWFPKLARLEPSGKFEHFSFHPQAEFYADFGRYDVTLDVPSDFVLGASGKLVEQTRKGNRKLARYVAEPVHDFAWTAWDGFQERRFRAENVDVRLLFPRGQELNAEHAARAVEFALPYLGNRFGSYPYETLTVVHPPLGAESAGGMEYPTLITTGADWYAPYLGMRNAEIVTVHELGHQWFYGLLASNEARFPFLDEGLNSYAEQATLSAYLGRASLFGSFGLSLAGDSVYRVFSAERAADEPIASAANEFSSFRNLGALVYVRTATLMETVARVWGKPRLRRALEVYAQRFRFAHPSPSDFLSVIESEVGLEARQMLENALFHRGQVDFVVEDLQNASTSAPAGFFERPSGRERIRKPPTEASPKRVGRATVYRHGSLVMPVDVLLVGSDGRRVVERWDGRGSFRVFEYRTGADLVSVVVDPDHKILVDDNLFNNQASATASSLPRLHERLGYFAAAALAGALP